MEEHRPLVVVEGTVGSAKSLTVSHQPRKFRGQRYHLVVVEGTVGNAESLRISRQQ